MSELESVRIGKCHNRKVLEWEARTLDFSYARIAQLPLNIHFFPAWLAGAQMEKLK